ncbi:MAG: HlyD family efflux transporter periplasmic adaptor subunit [Clostridiales bacterium]|nr:HlyD family efflux transporter periplasmic adaptor subunit [Clostridiales bacterium]
MKKSIKFIILGLVALTVVAGGAYAMMAPVTMPLTMAYNKAAELAFTEQGVVSAGQVVSVYPLAQGSLLSVDVQEGQPIRSGDVICVIDAEPLRLRLSELQAVIRSYEVQMKTAETQEKSSSAVNADRIKLQNALIEQSQRDLARAQEDLERMELLYEGGAVSQSDVENARALAEKYSSALTASRHELTVITAGANTGGMAEYYQALIDSAEATQKLLEQEIGNCTVKATVSGQVTRLPVSGTNVVSAAVPVAEITTIDATLIEAYVSTQDVDYVKAGDTVELVLKRREGDVRFPGTVTQVDTTATTRLSTLGVEERKVKVQISPILAGSGVESLGIGYSIDVRFLLYKEDNKLTVPKSALFRDGGKDMLWVVRDGKAQAIQVTLGMELRTETVVESGLSDGDVVVTDANNGALKDGVKIKGE